MRDKHPRTTSFRVGYLITHQEIKPPEPFPHPKRSYTAEGKIELSKPSIQQGSGKGLRNAPEFRVLKTTEGFPHQEIFCKPYNAEGKIEFENKPDPSKRGEWANLRNAPSFLPVKHRFPHQESIDKSYNAKSIAQFLGCMKEKGGVQERIRRALDALETEEEGLIDKEDLRGINPTVANEIVLPLTPSAFPLSSRDCRGLR